MPFESDCQNVLGFLTIVLDTKLKNTVILRLFRSLILWRNDGQRRHEQKEKDDEILSLCLYQLNPNHTMVVLNK